MPGHVGTEDLEKLFLAPESIASEEKKQIDAHLAQCALCREHMEALAEFYRDLPGGLSEPPLQRDEAVARRILDPSRKEELPGQLLQLPPHREGSIDLFGREGGRAPRSVALARMVHYIRSHPVRFAGGDVACGGALCICGAGRSCSCRGCEPCLCKDRGLRLDGLQQGWPSTLDERGTRFAGCHV